jgi:GTP cyclohydrolase I
MIPGAKITGSAEEADVIVDDIVDSGKTRAKYPQKQFAALYGRFPVNNTIIGEYLPNWLVFPWETMDSSAEDIGIRLLQYIGEDPTREGLRDTPKRFLKAWREWTSGYAKDPVAELKTEFVDGSEGYDEMVMIDPIPFDSFCEHHLAIIRGFVHLAYIPDGKIAGLSKFCRLVEVFARRLQVQERMTVQIAQTIQDVLTPLGCGVVIRAEHTCMSSRGARVFGAVTTTTALRGVFKKPEVRAEFLQMIVSR